MSMANDGLTLDLRRQSDLPGTSSFNFAFNGPIADLIAVAPLTVVSGSTSIAGPAFVNTTWSVGTAIPGSINMQMALTSWSAAGWFFSGVVRFQPVSALNTLSATDPSRSPALTFSQTAIRTVNSVWNRAAGQRNDISFGILEMDSLRGQVPSVVPIPAAGPFSIDNASTVSTGYRPYLRTINNMQVAGRWAGDNQTFLFEGDSIFGLITTQEVGNTPALGGIWFTGRFYFDPFLTITPAI